MIEKTIELTKKDMSDKKIRLVQFTNAISVKFRIADWEIPSGATARIYVKKKSGKEVFNDCLIDGDTNSIIFGTTTQMTAETGKNMAQIQIVSGNTTAASFGFLLEVSENIIEQTAVQSKDEYGVLQGLIKEARDAINGIQPVNNLIGTDPNRPLAAPMGKTLNDKITALNADLGRQSIKRFPMGNTKKFRITVPIDSYSNGNVISFLFFATYGAAFVSLIPYVSTDKVAMSANAPLSNYVTISSIDTGAEIAFTNYHGYVYYIVGNAVNMNYTIQPISS